MKCFCFLFSWEFVSECACFAFKDNAIGFLDKASAFVLYFRVVQNFIIFHRINLDVGSERFCSHSKGFMICY